MLYLYDHEGLHDSGDGVKRLRYPATTAGVRAYIKNGRARLKLKLETIKGMGAEMKAVAVYVSYCGRRKVFICGSLAMAQKCIPKSVPKGKDLVSVLNTPIPSVTTGPAEASVWEGKVSVNIHVKGRGKLIGRRMVWIRGNEAAVWNNSAREWQEIKVKE